MNGYAKESIEKDSVEINKGVIETLSNVDESSSVLDNLKTEKIPFRLDSGVINLTWNENADLKNGTKGGRRGTLSGELLFDTAFNNPPRVMMSISTLDLSGETNVRVYARVVHGSITTTGFKYDLATFSDSVVYGVGASWIAIGY